MAENNIFLGNPNEFRRSPWITETLSQVDALRGGQILDFDVPEGVDYRFFLAELGRSSRKHEIGGLIDPRTGSVRLMRGYAPFERGINAHVEFMPPREKPDGSIDDIMFHTHPELPISKSPVDSCRASQSDINALLATKMVEEEDGIDRPVSAIISSQGYLNILEAEGIQYDEELLQKSRFTDDQILKVKRSLGLAPPVWIGNIARDDNARNQLIILVTDFYRGRFDRTVKFSQKMSQLAASLKDLVRDERALKIGIDGISGHFPEFPSRTYLQNTGFEDDKVSMVQNLFGYKNSIYQVTELNGLKKIE